MNIRPLFFAGRLAQTPPNAAAQRRGTMAHQAAPLAFAAGTMKCCATSCAGLALLYR